MYLAVNLYVMASDIPNNAGILSVQTVRFWSL